MCLLNGSEECVCDVIAAMSEKHKTILRSKRPTLLKSVLVTERLLAELMSNNTITRDIKDEIMVNCFL